MHAFAGAAVTKYHKLGGHTTGMYCHRALEAGGLRTRCWQGRFLLRAERGNLFCAPLASGDMLAVAGVPWLVTAQLQSSRSILPPCVSLSVSKFPLLKVHSHIELGPTLMTPS